MFDNERLDKLEASANAAALRVRESAGSMNAADDIAVVSTVPREGASGSNSLDKQFVGSLKRGEHLNDNFLAGI